MLRRCKAYQTSSPTSLWSVHFKGTWLVPPAAPIARARLGAYLPAPVNSVCRGYSQAPRFFGDCARHSASRLHEAELEHAGGRDGVEEQCLQNRGLPVTLNRTRHSQRPIDTRLPPPPPSSAASPQRPPLPLNPASTTSSCIPANTTIFSSCFSLVTLASAR